ncbi:MAG: hypothetical protein AB4426_12430 [Xenococcaceae cyanobacterium]
MRNDVFTKLMNFLDYLEKSKISYTLDRNRDEAIMVTVVVPGERLEVEFLTDGSVEAERFISNGEIYGEEVFEEIFNKYSDNEDDGSNLAQSLKVATSVK